MLTLTLISSLPLSLSISLSPAIPIVSGLLPSSLAPRALFCANAPGTQAGSYVLGPLPLLPRNTSLVLLPRDTLSSFLIFILLSNRLLARQLHRSLQNKTLSGRVTNAPFCATNSRTYVLATLLEPLAGAASIAVSDLLIEAANFLNNHIVTASDGNIAGGRFDWPGSESLVLSAWNANNHQLTYGVLSAALQALQEWTWGEGFGTLAFDIYDGQNQVGQGKLEVVGLGT